MFSVNFEIRNPVLIEEKNYTDKVNRGGGAGGGGSMAMFITPMTNLLMFDTLFSINHRGPI